MPSPPAPRSTSPASDATIAALAKAGIEPLPFLYGAPRWAVHEVARARHRRRRQGAGEPAGRRPVRLRLVAVRPRRGRTLRPARHVLERKPRPPARPRPHLADLERAELQILRRPSQPGRIRATGEALRAPRSTPPTRAPRSSSPASSPAPPKPPSRPPPREAYNAVEFLDLMYRTNPGIGAKFDGVALHPYVTEYQRLPSEIEEVRQRAALARRRRQEALDHRDRLELGKPAALRRLRGRRQRPGDAADRRLPHPRATTRRAGGCHRSSGSRSTTSAGACNFCGGSGLFGNGFKPEAGLERITCASPAAARAELFRSPGRDGRPRPGRLRSRRADRRRPARRSRRRPSTTCCAPGSRRRPDEVAIVSAVRRLSWRELEDAAARLAARLPRRSGSSRATGSPR